MGNSNSSNEYITLTLVQNNKNIIISGFKDYKLDINVVPGTLVKTALNEFNKFRRPINKIYCIKDSDYDKVITHNMIVYIVLG